VRQLAEAEARDEQARLAATRAALLWGTSALALAGAAGFWLLRQPIATYILNDPAQSRTVGWLGVAVALTIIGNSQVALLNGFRRIGDIARVSVLGALLGTILGIGALLLWGADGIVAYVVAAPLAALPIGYWLVRRLPRSAPGAATRPSVLRQLSPMLRLGLSLMIAGLLTTAMLLAVRAIVGQRLGADALGHFSAAWMISMTYITFVLQAMGTDYFPRLSAVISDHEVANRMVDEQSEVALLLAAPVLIGMQAAAPWVIHLLYSSQFAPSIEVLRWQIAGDVLKIASWPLGFILLASGSGRLFVIAEGLAAATFVGFVWLAIGRLGLVSTAAGFVAMYVLYLPFVSWLARRRTGFRWSGRLLLLFGGAFAAVTLTGLCGAWSGWLGLAVGFGLAGIFSAYALFRLDALGTFHGRLAPAARLAAALRRAAGGA